MATIPHSTTGFVKDLRRNRETREWDAHIIIGGAEIYVGNRRCSWNAEQLCDQYVYDQLMQQSMVEPPPEAEGGLTTQQTLSKTRGIEGWRQCKEAVLTRDGRRCVLCGTSESLTLHHIRPKAIGGDSTQQNLVTICKPCHQAINRLTQWFASWLIWSYGMLMLWMARGKTRRAR